MSNLASGDAVEIEIIYKHFHKWMPATFVKYDGVTAVVRVQTPVGVLLKRVPPSKMRRNK